MGVGLQPLEFTECIADSPHFREKLHAHEKELEETSQQMKKLVKELKDLLNAAKNLSRAQRALSVTLQTFRFECIGTSQTDDELVISKSLAEFGRLIEAIEDERAKMMEKTHEQIIIPLENFRKQHIGGVKEGKKKFEKQTAKFCQSQERYLSLSTKKQDTFLQEADATLEMEQRHFYQASLQYVFLLQEVQERKKFEFVEILLTLMLGWLTFYHQGHDAAGDYRPYMTELQLRIQKTRENFNATRDKTESLMKKTLEMRQTKTVDAGSTQTNSREGYLFLMEKKAFGTTTWTKQYCTYQKDTKEFCMIPYNQMSGKFNAAEKMILASCVRRMSDSIEKRFCFDLTPSDRAGVVYTLQALSEEDRKQWMDVMDGKEPMYSVPGGIKPVNKTEDRVLDELGFNFVTRCIEVLDERGLEEQGLYRVVGVTSKVTRLLQLALDKKKTDKLFEDNSEWETKTITSALKTYLRSLSEPIMTFKFHNSFINAAKLETQAKRVNEVHSLVHRLPKPNYDMLEILIRHLSHVAAHSDKNLMTVSNLGVCFGPTLLRPEEETVAAIMDIKFCNVVVEILIENYNKIFKTPYTESNLQPHSITVDSPPRQQSQPIPRKPASAGTAHVRPFYDVGGNLSNSLHNVATRNAVPRGQFQGFQPGRRGSFGRVANAVAAYSEGNLHLISSAHQTHPIYASPPTTKHNILPPAILNSDQLNSTSSSNESVSSLCSRDLSNHNYGTPQKRNSTHAPEISTTYQSRMQYQTGRVRTLYACLGENDGELSFEPNQIITNVRSSVEPGWLEGTLNGKSGLVPENYVEPLL
ncbi:rho GTPase-activating protein 26 [Cimex lectularius]|uniref:Rho GTPase-activating protein 26 n=1 Tax=Cimex lectularius TaxID=79782 RepID=A0A8I6TMY8_CIMLE|nr:rho GTPase-activating protein 26 [Cimex lectularius]